MGSVTGNDKHAGTREMPLRTVAQALEAGKGMASLIRSGGRRRN